LPFSKRLILRKRVVKKYFFRIFSKNLLDKFRMCPGWFLGENTKETKHKKHKKVRKHKTQNTKHNFLSRSHPGYIQRISKDFFIPLQNQPFWKRQQVFGANEANRVWSMCFTISFLLGISSWPCIISLPALTLLYENTIY
jgi:hypothetical protein